MSVLEKIIIKEIENKIESLIDISEDEPELCDAEDWYDEGVDNGKIKAYSDAINIIRSHIDEVPKCGECSRRKWYQKGYNDGLKANQEIVYFELNNWSCGKDYPADEPFISWMRDDLNIKFNNEKWVKENKLCVVKALVDMSFNYCITATKEWVEKNCPSLLTQYTQFIRLPDEDGCVFGRFDHEFLEYKEGNFGIEYIED